MEREAPAAAQSRTLICMAVNHAVVARARKRRRITYTEATLPFALLCIWGIGWELHVDPLWCFMVLAVRKSAGAAALGRVMFIVSGECNINVWENK